MSSRRRTDLVRRILAAVLLMAGLLAATGADAMQPPAGGAQEGFVPVDQLPPEEALPAAPLLIAAYIVAWIAVVAYLWSIWRRLAKVERELADVGRRIEGGGRG